MPTIEEQIKKHLAYRGRIARSQDEERVAIGVEEVAEILGLRYSVVHSAMAQLLATRDLRVALRAETGLDYLHWGSDIFFKALNLPETTPEESTSQSALILAYLLRQARINQSLGTEELSFEVHEIALALGLAPENAYREICAILESKRFQEESGLTVLRRKWIADSPYQELSFSSGSNSSREPDYIEAERITPSKSILTPSSDIVEKKGNSNRGGTWGCLVVIALLLLTVFGCYKSGMLSGDSAGEVKHRICERYMNSWEDGNKYDYEACMEKLLD